MNKKPRDQPAMICCTNRKKNQVLSRLGPVSLQLESGLDKIRAEIDNKARETF